MNASLLVLSELEAIHHVVVNDGLGHLRGTEMLYLDGELSKFLANALESISVDWQVPYRA